MNGRDWKIFGIFTNSHSVGYALWGVGPPVKSGSCGVHGWLPELWRWPTLSSLDSGSTCGNAVEDVVEKAWVVLPRLDRTVVQSHYQEKGKTRVFCLLG